MNKIFHNRIIIYFIPIILPLSLLHADERIGIAQMSDPQPFIQSQAKAKEGHTDIIKEMAANKSVDKNLQNRTYLTAIPGDLIDGQFGQTAEFKQKYLYPIDAAKIRVLLGAVNHNAWWHPEEHQAFLDAQKKADGSFTSVPVTVPIVGVYAGPNTKAERTSCANSREHIHNDLY